jgi:hypothetical protein
MLNVVFRQHRFDLKRVFTKSSDQGSKGGARGCEALAQLESAGW